jgi:hypothetical protein
MVSEKGQAYLRGRAADLIRWAAINTTSPAASPVAARPTASNDAHTQPPLESVQRVWRHDDSSPMHPRRAIVDAIFYMVRPGGHGGSCQPISALADRVLALHRDSTPTSSDPLSGLGYVRPLRLESACRTSNGGQAQPYVSMSSRQHGHRSGIITYSLYRGSPRCAR